jgi:hypothetical protein
MGTAAGAVFAAAPAMAQRVAIAGGCAGTLRLRAAGFGGRFGNIIVRRVFCFCRLARRPRARCRDHGGVCGEGAGIHHGDEVGAGRAHSRARFSAAVQLSTLRAARRQRLRAVRAGEVWIEGAKYFRRQGALRAAAIRGRSRRDLQKLSLSRQQRLKRRPEPQGQGSLRPSFSTSSLSPWTTRSPRLTEVSLLKAPPALAHRFKS